MIDITFIIFGITLNTLNSEMLLLIIMRPR